MQYCQDFIAFIFKLNRIIHFRGPPPTLSPSKYFYARNSHISSNLQSEWRRIGSSRRYYLFYEISVFFGFNFILSEDPWDHLNGAERRSCAAANLKIWMHANAKQTPKTATRRAYYADWRSRKFVCTMVRSGLSSSKKWKYWETNSLNEFCVSLWARQNASS